MILEPFKGNCKNFANVHEGHLSFCPTVKWVMKAFLFLNSVPFQVKSGQIVVSRTRVVLELFRI